MSLKARKIIKHHDFKIYENNCFSLYSWIGKKIIIYMIDWVVMIKPTLMNVNNF